jgi:hypothetical protein
MRDDATRPPGVRFDDAERLLGGGIDPEDVVGQRPTCSSAVNATRLWDPSQKGFFADWPQRQR